MRRDEDFVCDFCEKVVTKNEIEGWYYLSEMKKNKSYHFCGRECLQFFVINIIMVKD